MFFKTKAGMNGAARIVLNTFEEVVEDYKTFLLTGSMIDFQEYVESEATYLYNMIQRTVFVDTLNLHFGVLGEMEKLGRGEEGYIRLNYGTTDTGIEFQADISADGNSEEIILEVYHMHAALQGVVLNTPMSDRK